MKIPGLVAFSVVVLAASCFGATSEPRGGTTVRAQTTEMGVARVPLRRLTREEYNNSVRDLLGDTTRPANAFPPDEAVQGFESNQIAPATSLLVQRYADASEALAAAAKGRLAALAPCAPGQDHALCARSFVDAFGRLVFRRPLEDGERAALLSVYSDKQRRSDYAGGIQLTIEAMLQSPQFLYRVEPQDGPGVGIRPLNGYELATRLSFFLWESTPDPPLLDAAAAGQLATPEDVEAAARRMLTDPRAKDGIRSFHRQWLGLRELETASKSGALSVRFTPALKDAMVEETLRFSERAVLDGGDAIMTLLTSRTTFVNAPLAALYGVSPPREGFALVELPSGQRAGLLTHASVLAVHASADQTSPVLRGKFVREKLLCQAIPPPPPSTNVTPPLVDPKLTTKERFLRHQTDPSCAGCHQMMDPIGFGFEHYDALGAWRTTDAAFPVDSVGELSFTDAIDGPFDGAVELAARLAASEQVRRCVATQWFRFALGAGEHEEDASSLAEAYDAFAQRGFDVRELLVAIAKSHAFRHARLEEGGAP